MNTDLYRLLGVSAQADSDTLKQAAQKRLQTFKQAYKILSSPEKRPLYDARYAQQAENFYSLLEVPHTADAATIAQAVQEKAEQVKRAYAILGNAQKRTLYDQKSRPSSAPTASTTGSASPSPTPPAENIPVPESNASPTSTPPPEQKPKQRSRIGRLVKFTAVTLGVLLLLIVLAVLGIYLFFNPNDYKAQIETLVQQETGRTFKLDGDIQLSIFPWVGLELNQARLGNAPGFSDPEFAKIERLHLKVKLMPLLSQKLEMDTLSLTGAEVYLTRLVDRRSNWDDLLVKSAAQPTPSSPETSATFDPTRLHIGGIHMENAALHWDDQQHQQLITLSKVNLNIGAIALPEPIKVDLDAEVVATQPTAAHFKLALNTQIQFNPANGQLEIRDLNWDTHIQSALVPQGEQLLNLKLQHLFLDQTEQVLQLKNLSLSTLGLTLQGDFDIIEFLNAPDISGKLALNNFNPRELLSTLGQSTLLPVSTALQNASLTLAFNMQTDSGDLRLSDLHLKLDDNQLLMPQLQWNMQQNTVQMDSLSLQAADLKAQASLHAKNLFGVQQVQGAIEVQPFDLQALLTRLGVVLHSQDAQALRKVALRTQLAGDFNQLELDNFMLSLDDSQLIGGIQFNPVTQALSFDLSLDQLNVDRYLSKSSAAQSQVVQSTTPELPLAQLRQLNLNGKLAIHALQVQGQKLQDIQLGVFAQQGEIKLSPQLSYQEFKTSGRWLLNVQQEPAQLKLTQELQSQQIGGGKISLSTHLNIKKNLHFSGDLSLAVEKVRALAQNLHLPLPPAQDANTLTHLSFNAQGIEGDVQNIAFKQLQIAVDETQMKGHLSVQNFAQPALSFDLQGNQINLDRYLPPPAPSQTTPAAPSNAALPLEALRQLNVTGVLQLDKAQIAKLHLDKLRIEISGKEGEIQLKQQMGFYQGQLQAETYLDARKTPVQLRLKEELSEVQAEPLFNDLQDGKGILKGLANFSTELTASGTQVAELISSLSGTLAFSFNQGAIKGFNLNDSIAAAKAIASGKLPPPMSGKPETTFSQLKGKLVLQQGNLHTDEIQLQSPYLRCVGTGDIALSTQSLDYRLNVTVLDKKTGDTSQTEPSGISIPVTLTGAWQKPNISVDVKKVLSEGVQHQFDKQLEKHGDELKGKALEKLRGIF